MASFTVLGAGMMGSALCVPLVDRGHDVRLVGTHLDGDVVASLRERHLHPKMGLTLPEAINPFFVEELDQALEGADFVALGVSSAGVEWAIEQLAPRLRDDQPLFMITKGLRFDGQSLRVLVNVVERALPRSGGVAAIAGPCIAGELARRMPTCVMLTAHERGLLDRLASELSTPYYHPATSTDVIGVEICAALKNAYAMGVAFGAGLHERGSAHGVGHGAPGSIAMHNLESAVFGQAMVEMQWVVWKLGGEPSSVAGLAGAGDLDVTNNGGRTGRFGRLLGLGLSRQEAIDRMEGATLECLEILEVMRAAVRAWRSEAAVDDDTLPLLEHLAAVALDGAPVDLPLDRFFRTRI